MYDTEQNNKKMICSKNKSYMNIECRGIIFNLSKALSNNIIKYTFQIIYTVIWKKGNLSSTLEELLKQI